MLFDIAPAVRRIVTEALGIVHILNIQQGGRTPTAAANQSGHGPSLPERASAMCLTCHFGKAKHVVVEFAVL